MEEKAEELRVLAEMRMEAEGGFTPRRILPRTPPEQFSTPSALPLTGPRTSPAPTHPPAGKRLLASPEEVQEAVRRKLGSKRGGRAEVPPMGGLLTATPEPATESTSNAEVQQRTMAVDTLAGDEIAAIDAFTERLAAVVTHLTVRLAAAEAALKNNTSSITATNAQASNRRSFANALRVGRSRDPVPIPRPPGLAVVVYPAEDQTGNLRTSEATKARTAINPAQIGVQVAGLRRVGNAGVVVQTTSEEAAKALRSAVPPTLRTAEPTERCPLIALSGIDQQATTEEVVADIVEQNLREDPIWTRERVAKELRRNRCAASGGVDNLAVIVGCQPTLTGGCQWRLAAIG
ncbi:hypothetical protein HF086_015758 [Spodoptera exigua]|uniref:Uncharacterized protein n=1 Tax=Spodoptera exigua TaxID=7107 RepID=A0A922M1W2_SPOEX|nr:hypothetical protein HF086_015758 [Spodoptera exigua]